MDKPNVFKSSNFHMDAGDVLHMLFLDETGVTVDVDLWSSETTTETIPDAPTALDASDITDSSFTANWYFNENSTGYYLDVATDSAFTAMVAGYNNLSVGNVNSYSVIGLSDGRGYYFRVRASNTAGTSANSNTEDLVTDFAIITDGDGNVYTPLIIGTQVWLLENLKTTKYIDGTAIPNVINDALWQADATGAYCWYDNDIAYKNVYGALYNWHAVNNAHGLAPLGYRVATDDDFLTLTAYVGGVATAGGTLKETGTTHWTTPNTGATNTFNFTALPAGYRTDLGGYFSIGVFATIWTSTELSADYAWHRYFSYNSATIQKVNLDKNSGISVRCVKDL